MTPFEPRPLRPTARTYVLTFCVYPPRRDGAKALANTLSENAVLTSLKVAYNIGLTEEAKQALREAAERRVNPPLTLEM